MSGSHDDPPGTSPTPEEREFSIARSNALAPLLVLFGVLVLGVVLVIVRAAPYTPAEGAPADHAYGPADFPQVFPALDPNPLPKVAAADGTNLFPVPPPPFSKDIFPCSSCHADMEPDPERRELVAMHDDIVLKHDEEHRWCLDCHDLKDRDNLRLASGALVPFTESYRLCGQCHGTQYRDWRSGIHGKRVGYWNGPKQYLLCVNCHNPHHPRFAALQPLPPPVRPQRLRDAIDPLPNPIVGPDATRKKEDAGHAGVSH